MFQNDFFIIADYFFQMRKTGTYQGSDRNVRHMREVLQLLSALTNDPRFIWKTYAEKEGAEPKNMCEWIDKIEEKGMEKGIKKERLDAIARMMSAGLTKDQILSCGYTKDELAESESLLYANA